MKVFSVNGFTRSGKTTTVENIIKELKQRGYSVGSVKEIHYDKFKIDTKGTNTDRHRQAGAEQVVARSFYETDIMFNGMLPMDKILSFFEQDYVVLEGVSDVNAPKIITAHNADEIEERNDYRTFMVSGVISNSLKEYAGMPVINGMTDINRMVDRIEEKVPHLLPDFDKDCCSACGFDCHTLLKKILSGEKKREDCTIEKGNIKLYINGKEITMVPFVNAILKNAVLGVVKELNGYEKDASLKITLD